jgi:murein L,D-transpeptidase YafK
MTSAFLLCALAGCLSAPALPATPGLSARMPGGPGGPVPLADSIVIEKKAHRLTLYHLGRPIKQFMVALGAEPERDKQSAGDRRTPTGLFSIESRNANSEFHLALRIAYPDSAHIARAAALGVSPGGGIEIHGLLNGRGSTGAFHRTADWTNGCIALTDEEIEELWSSVPVGIPVEIKP